MTAFDQDFWDLTFDVVTYAVDSSHVTPLRRRDNSNLATITEQIFLDELYVARNDSIFEESLAREMARSIPVVCLVAGRGCGKTSTLRYAKRLVEAKSPRARVLTLDVKRCWDQGLLVGLNVENAAERFRQVLFNFVYFELFSGREEYLRLLAWLLAGRPDPTDSFDPGVVADLVLESNRARAIIGETSKSTRDDRFRMLEAEFVKNKSFFSATLQEVQSKLRLVHLVVGAQHIRDVEKVVLVIDNVDRVSGLLQPALMQCVMDGQLRMGSACTTVIAIRRENVRDVAPRPGEGGDILVHVSIHEEKHDGLLLPTDGPDHPASILGKRRDYSSRLYQKQVLDADLVHSRVVSQFLHERVHDLANGSIRSIIGIYHSFMRYVIEVANAERFDVLANLNDEGFLQTLLFLWLRLHGESQGIPLYDVLKPEPPLELQKAYSDLADIRHLILTCLLNSSSQRTLFWSYGDYPTVKAVFGRMRLLGFDFDEFRTALGEVCAKPGEPPKLVEIYPTEVNAGDLEELSVERLRLTQLGRALLENTTSKVGYNWANALSVAPSHLRRSGNSYFSMDRDDRMKIVYHYCKQRAIRHLRLMSFLQSEWRQRFGEDWLARYRVFFGVETRVHVERLLRAADAFFFRDRKESQFLWLESRYVAQLNKLGGGIAYENLDLKSLDGRG